MRSLIVLCASFLMAFSSTGMYASGQDLTAPTTRPAVKVDYLHLKPAGDFTAQTLEIGEVGLGEEVPVLVRVLNRSSTDFEMTLKENPKNKSRLLNGPVKIADGENGLAELIIKIPDSTMELKGSVGVVGNLGGKKELHLHFNFRYRDLALFTKSFYSYSLDVPSDELASRPLSVQLPIDLSTPDLINECSIEADASLQSISFQIAEKDDKAYVEAKFPGSLIAKSRASGKIRLKIRDKIVSESTLIVRKQTDIELLPDFVTLKYDPDKQEYRGELIAKLRVGTVPIEQIKIEAEHVDDIPIDLSIGKMSKSNGRIYVTVKGTENPKNQDLILFRIMTPLKTEEHVLSLAVIR